MRAPGFITHVFLLWGLRLRIGLNRGSGGQGVLAVAAFLFSSAPSVVLAATFYRLMQLPAIADSDLWPDFIVRLLSFVTTCVWVTWPVLSAGVDDHSELSRYSAFPISGWRLLVSSTLASLFEPRALVFYGPLVGATAGYLAIRPGEAPLLVLLNFAAFVLFNAALSRVGLHLVLSLLKQPRSAELLGGGFILSLIAASFIPPVDTSWLTRLSEIGPQAVPDTLVEQAVLALGRFPTGWFAVALTASWAGKPARALVYLIGTGLLFTFTLAFAYWLLVRFHQSTGRTVGQSERAEASNPFARTRTMFSTLVAREALDLWFNPRARLLAAVPFVLGILLKLLSARDLFRFFLGETADAWVLGGLCVYGAIVMGSTFSQNAFAYDGHGFTVFLSSPLPLGSVLKAKNLVHGVAAFALASIVAVFYVGYFRHGSALDAACAFAGVLTVIPVLLAAGNFLSLYFPVKFHANLKRRDKLPFLASMLGVAAASVGTAPFGWALTACGKQGPTAQTLVLMLGAAVLAWGLYRATLPLALGLLDGRRELILRAVTRE